MSTLNNRTKFGPQRSGMTHKKWRKNRSIWNKSGARMVHESAKIVPVSPLAPNGVLLTGGTYSVGRNAAKRAKRAEAVAARKAEVAARLSHN